MRIAKTPEESRFISWLSFFAVLIFLGLVLLLDQLIKPTSSLYMLLTVLQKGSVYALAAVSMNLLNGYTGLFSLGHAGFMLIGAYTYAIRTGTKVLRVSLSPPIATLNLLVRAKLFSRFEPLVTGPSFCHWQTARMISAKPRVAMAR